MSYFRTLVDCPSVDATLWLFEREDWQYHSLDPSPRNATTLLPQEIIRMMGHVIGKVIKIGYNTELVTRGKFAQIVVEVSLARPMISQFLLYGRIQKVDYESFLTICFGCRMYGHMCSSCLEKLNIEPQDTSVILPDSIAVFNGKLPFSSATGNVNPNNPRFGPWMVVARKWRNHNVSWRQISKGYVICTLKIILSAHIL